MSVHLQALERQLADIEPVFEMVVSEGAALTRLVPGEGAENISQVRLCSSKISQVNLCPNKMSQVRLFLNGMSQKKLCLGKI